jgi:antitoxin component YwqK of YwqJK toxin-antitoxin module
MQKRIVLKELYDKFHAELNGDNAPVDTTTKPTLELTTKKTKKEEAKEKKIRKTTFYGIKTRRAFTRKGKDSKRYEYEIFFVLKKWQEPTPYVKDIYWYHRKKRAVYTSKIEDYDKKYARILHGPYMKRIGKNLVEEGIYFLGAKHGRWVKYDKNFLLTDKRRFYKGWPTESEITYYDTDQKKPKEIIPIQFGRRDGEYFLYSPDGALMVNGIYKENTKIGIWTEYHANKKKKKETQYGKDPFAKDFIPYVIKEYNDKGKATFDYKKDAPKVDSVSVKQ